MNIRASIFGGENSAEKPLLRPKKPKKAKSESLEGLIEREESRSSHNRLEDRHRLLDEAVQLKCPDGTHDVQLINLSGGGAMVGGALELMLWDKVELCLGENGTVECVVRWVRDGRFGLEFAHETRIDCGADQQAAILREVIRRSFPDLQFEADSEPQPIVDQSGPDGRSERRHPLVWSGVLHHDYQSTPVRVRNISTTGVMVDCPERLTIGSEPLLELSEALSVSATVEWMVGDQAGLRFHSPFDLRDLAQSRPEVTAPKWQPPSYLASAASAESPWGEHWGRMSLGELRQELEGFLKR